MMAGKRVCCKKGNGHIDFHRPRTMISVLKTAECEIAGVWSPDFGMCLVELEPASIAALKCGEDHA